jgi:hypothetical protein
MFSGTGRDRFRCFASRTMLEASVLAVSGPYFLANRTSLVIVMILTV